VCAETSILCLGKNAFVLSLLMGASVYRHYSKPQPSIVCPQSVQSKTVSFTRFQQTSGPQGRQMPNRLLARYFERRGERSMIILNAEHLTTLRI
jgi:hypothetical protein